MSTRQAAQPTATSQPGALDAAAVRRVWDEILTSIGRKRRAAAAVAREATVREVEGDTLVLLFKHAVHANMLRNAPELLLEAVFEVLGAPAPGARWQVRCEVTGQGSAGGSGTPPASPQPVPPAPRSAPARDDEGWPETASPGGTAPVPRPEPRVDAVQAPEPAEGFDPDDEPLDEVLDEQAARQTSEQQALHLLAQALGAEKIGELDSR